MPMSDEQAQQSASHTDVNPRAPAVTPAKHPDGGLALEASAGIQMPSSHSVVESEPRKIGNTIDRDNESPQQDLPPSQPPPSRRYQQPRLVVHGARRVSSTHLQRPAPARQAPLSDDDEDSDGGVPLPGETEIWMQVTGIEDVPEALLGGRRGGITLERSDDGPGTETGASRKSPGGRGVLSVVVQSGNEEAAGSNISTRQEPMEGDRP